MLTGFYLRDVSAEKEIERFFDFNMYRCGAFKKRQHMSKIGDKFIPYFSKNKGGVKNFADIFEIKMGTPAQILSEIANNPKFKTQKMFSKWIDILSEDISRNENETFTYFFLGEIQKTKRSFTKKELNLPISFNFYNGIIKKDSFVFNSLI